VFRGRKIGTARRFAKTLLVIILALLPAIVAGQGRAVSGTVSVEKQNVTKQTASGSDLSDRLPKGRRAYSIVVDNGNAAIVSDSAGRRIDITAAFPAGADGMPSAVTVLRSAPVIGSKPAQGGTALLLSVTPADAERLAFAAANARIFVSLCPNGPDISAPTSGVTFSDF
jgi:hypothetical protein